MAENEFAAAMEAVLGHIDLVAIGRAFHKHGWTADTRIGKLVQLCSHEDGRVALGAQKALDDLAWRGAQVSGLLQRVSRTAQIAGQGGATGTLEESGYRLVFPTAPQNLAEHSAAMLEEASRIPQLPTEPEPDVEGSSPHKGPDDILDVEAVPQISEPDEVIDEEPLNMGSFRVVKPDGTYVKTSELVNA